MVAGRYHHLSIAQCMYFVHFLLHSVSIPALMHYSMQSPFVRRGKLIYNLPVSIGLKKTLFLSNRNESIYSLVSPSMDLNIDVGHGRTKHCLKQMSRAFRSLYNLVKGHLTNNIECLRSPSWRVKRFTRKDLYFKMKIKFFHLHSIISSALFIASSGYTLVKTLAYSVSSRTGSNSIPVLDLISRPGEKMFRKGSKNVIQVIT